MTKASSIGSEVNDLTGEIIQPIDLPLKEQRSKYDRFRD